MRATYVLLASATLALPGCTLVLGIDSLQGGDAGARDAGSFDARVSDAAPDAADLDGSIPLDAPMPDGDVDGGAIDGGAIDDGAIDAGPPIDSGPRALEVGGSVVGLPAGMTLRLRNGADTEDVAGGAGPTSFTFLVAADEPYDVTIETAPGSLLCVVYRGSGTAAADVSNLFVGCSTAADLVSFFPFDGDLHAARGADWTTLSGSVTYATNRAGEPGMALAATTGTDIRLARPLDGRATTVAPGATQFTVTAWVRVPPSLPAGTVDSIFGHYGPVALSTDLRVAWRSGTPYFDEYFYWDGGFDRAHTESTTVLDREWHHVAVSASGPGDDASTPFVRSIYVDGVLEASTSTCCGWGNATTYWLLPNSRVERDDLRLYSRKLSDAEIAGIYAAENVP